MEQEEDDIDQEDELEEQEGEEEGEIEQSADEVEPPNEVGKSEDKTEPSPPPPSMPPALSLDLRLRWLETLLYGARPDVAERKPHDAQKGTSLARRAAGLQHKLDTLVQGNDGLRKFMDHYDQHAQYLSPAFTLSGVLPTPAAPAYAHLSPTELDALLVEMEPDIRAADRDLREIQALEERGVTGAGRLAEHKDLQPRLDALLKAQEEDARRAEALERRIAKLMERYASRVDTLSELFVVWDETIGETEDQVSRLERDREERRRLGYE
ncbi:hypothetical protein WOLCODRAFT_81749 [Wolfiporia cocos MD-104 SS10]|uniref:Uncharacterized protein n=1 Tax=Wolfiporia cocos (strain MD-104) TaxID=742152 RepID=A0A2H3JEZ1_WOLCO|nr:hypothetical protein WOLCODRAFT_81749 [Wolfiporia cocos MD-104 SS10]